MRSSSLPRFPRALAAALAWTFLAGGLGACATAPRKQQDVVWPHGKPPPSSDFEARWKWRATRTGPDSEQRPSGRLALKITSYAYLDPPRRSWRDGKTQRVENMLNEFVAAVVDLGERHRLWAALRAREQREREEAERRHAEEAARCELESRRRADLRRRTMKWCRARDIEELLAAFEGVRRAEAHESWLRWAHGEVKRLREAALAAPAMPELEEPSADRRG